MATVTLIVRQNMMRLIPTMNKTFIKTIKLLNNQRPQFCIFVFPCIHHQNIDQPSEHVLPNLPVLSLLQVHVLSCHYAHMCYLF